MLRADAGDLKVELDPERVEETCWDGRRLEEGEGEEGQEEGVGVAPLHFSLLLAHRP